jgi:proteic killer suppression protein
MDVEIANKKLKKILEDDVERQKRFGADMAKKIKIRLGGLAAAVSLADFWPPKSGPERCHELKGDRAGIFSIDVKQPYRILFKPVFDDDLFGLDENMPYWNGIQRVTIIGIEDTHE